MSSYTTRNGRILVVDDESFIREAIELYFATEGYSVSVAANGREALALLEREKFDSAILDVVMPGMSGIELLREMKKSYPDIEIIMASGNGTLQTAIEAIRLGAYDYITKPILNFDEDLLKVVKKAIERKRLLATNRKLAFDLQDINRELKQSNAKLRRRIAELETVCEIGRLISEINDFEGLMDLVEGTLQYQLGVEHSLLLVQDGEGWRVVRAPGFASTGADVVHSQLVLPEFPVDSFSVHRSVAQVSGLQEIVNSCHDSSGEAEPVSEHCEILPLRSGATNRGALIAFSKAFSPDDEEGSRAQDHVARLQVFVSQLASPLALLMEGVSHDS